MQSSWLRDIIDILAVSKYYDSVRALEDITLKIEPGQIYGILGPNGSGKTTLLKLICSIIKPTSGRVSVLGVDTVSNPNAVKSLVGYVPETPALYESLSVTEQLEFIAGIRGVQPDEYQKRSDEFLKAFELEDRSSEFIGTLSFGNRQKVAIISALLHDPQVIILDEGMNGLDPRSSKILKSLLQAMAAKGKTIIFSTHILEIAQVVCSTISILYRGRIVDSGTYRDLESRYSSGASSLEEVFLKLTGSADLDPTVDALVRSLED